MREDVAVRRPVRTRVIVWLSIGLGAIVLSALLGLWILVRGDEPFVVDVWWNSLFAGAGTGFVTGFALVMDFLGGGWFGALVVPIGGAVALVVLRRPWSAAYFLAASAVSAGIVQIFKHVFGRIRPEDILVISDFGSYPSGHVANAATIAVAAALLFPRRAVVVAGAVWVLLMAFSRTYLHAHWLSDTVGGALAGVGAAFVVAAAFAVPLTRELPGQPRSS